MHHALAKYDADFFVKLGSMPDARRIFAVHPIIGVLWCVASLDVTYGLKQR